MPKVFVREPFCAVFHFFVFRKSLVERRRVSRFSVEIYLSLSAEKFRRLESFSVSLISDIEEFFASEAYVTFFEFLSKFFCLTVPTNLVAEPFRVSLISGIEIVWIRGGIV